MNTAPFTSASQYSRTWICTFEDDTISLGREFGMRAYEGLVLLLEGGLGAGKTVFARGFATGLGIEVPITSPTYPIIQEYEGRLPFAHMDLYRIQGFAQAEETGMFEYIKAPWVCLIEWPERAIEAFDASSITVRILASGDGKRTITASAGQTADTRMLDWFCGE